MSDPAATTSHLTFFPLKSARGIPLLSARVGNKGLADDRSMMVVDETGRGITARALPALFQIRVMLDGDEVVLLAPGKKPIAFQRAALAPASRPVSVWGIDVSAQDGGEEISRWLSDFLERPCRLVLQDDRRPRSLNLGVGGIVSLADTAPLLLANEGSLTDLNLYLEQPVEMGRFRPNVVISGAAAFEEDGWAAIRIGEVEFEVAGGCDRCIMTTLDPETGEARIDSEPLATLGRRRRGENGKVYFGQYLIPRSEGRIYIGDAVEVLASKNPLSILPGTARKVVRLPSVVAASPAAVSGHRLLTCVGITDETPDMKTFRFVADTPFSYMAGQFITLLPVIDGSEIRRNYTISSSPSRPLQISVTVKRTEDGHVSNWLHKNLRVGDQLNARGPSGRFHLGAAGEAQKLLLVSAGSGVTPMMSILRYVADTDLVRDIVFHHCARTVSDIPFLDELQLLGRQLDGRLRFSWNLTGGARPSGASLRGAVHSGRINTAMMMNICPDLAERSAFCCGPAGFRSTIREIFADHQLGPAGAYLEESFGSGLGAEQLPAIGDYSVDFLRSGKVVQGNGTTTLLAAARQAGIEVPSDCEAGICGTCRCTVTAGEWRIAANAADRERSVLSDEEKAANVVLACTTSPIGPVVVEL